MSGATQNLVNGSIDLLEAGIYVFITAIDAFKAVAKSNHTQ